MADKIKAIKIKQENGFYSEEIPIGVNVQNVQWDENNHTLLDALGSVDISSSGKGNLQHQIDELDGDKISTNEFNSRLNDFLKDQISADTTDWLDDNVNPVGSAVIVDKTLTIEGAAADALAVKTELNKKANASNTYTKAEVNAAIDAKKIEVDDTLSITGTAADAKAVGDELTAVKADLGSLGDSLQSQTGIISKVEGSYIDLTTDPISLTPVVNETWSYSVVSCAEGDTFIINADGGQRPRAWGFLDSSNHVLSVADASTVVEDLELTAPTNAVKLIINDRSGAASYISSAYLLTKIAESAQGKVDVQQSPSDYGKALVINRDGQVQPGVVSGGSGLTDSVKVALLACLKHVHWDDEHSVDYYDALEAALYAAESRLTAVIDYGNATLFEDDPFSKIKWMMKVYYDGVEVSLQNYTLTGNMIVGQNVLTITYNDESIPIMVEAEENSARRLSLTGGNLSKFDGSGLSITTGGHNPPYLVPTTTERVYYTVKGHRPYVDENNNIVNGTYPIPIPAWATRVKASVAPHSYQIAINCWRYNNSIYNYTFIAGTDTGYNAWYSETTVAQFESNPRAVNVIVRKPDRSAFNSSEEPTEVVVQFFE